MPERTSVFVPLDAMSEPLQPRAATALGWPLSRVGTIRVTRRSLDARKGRSPGYHLELQVCDGGEQPPVPDAPAATLPHWPVGKARPNIVVVGSGPAGTWAALNFVRMGLGCTVVEQGKPVQPRRHDLAKLQRGILDAASNYCFGEGGAGTYSDGKLYTRAKDRDGVSRVLADLTLFGAPDEIQVESRPHVGSNRLPKVLTALREHLESQGVTYRFGTTVSGLRIERGQVRGVRLDGGDELPADVVVLATGHSARSVYEWAATSDIAMERKPLAIGVRMEHPQPLINRLQYGSAAEHPALPPAFYELKARSGWRGVYSFCMCPGGWLVPAATETDGVVVNGMSLSRRDSPFANSGLVVSVSAEDMGPASEGVLAGVKLQRKIERAIFAAGGGRFAAGAERLTDFLGGKTSQSLPATSYHPGVVSASLRELFPASLANALYEGLEALGRRHPILLSPDALLIAGETRTSSPVRLLRDPQTLESPGVTGLYPVGEGAGYAGGIVSAALDGARAAESAVRARV